MVEEILNLSQFMAKIIFYHNHININEVNFLMIPVTYIYEGLLWYE